MSLLLAMSVPSQFVVLVMSMSEKMGTSLAPSARLGTKGTKVSLFVQFYFLSLYFIFRMKKMNLDFRESTSGGR